MPLSNLNLSAWWWIGSPTLTHPDANTSAGARPRSVGSDGSLALAADALEASTGAACFHWIVGTAGRR